MVLTLKDGKIGGLVTHRMAQIAIMMMCMDEIFGSLVWMAGIAPQR
jgi:hypothetical protein